MKRFVEHDGGHDPGQPHGAGDGHQDSDVLCLSVVVPVRLVQVRGCYMLYVKDLKELRMTSEQAVEFRLNPLDDDVTVVVYFCGLQNHTVNTKSTWYEVIMTSSTESGS